jgi:hypothetical protein
VISDESRAGQRLLSDTDLITVGERLEPITKAEIAGREKARKAKEIADAYAMLERSVRDVGAIAVERRTENGISWLLSAGTNPPFSGQHDGVPGLCLTQVPNPSSGCVPADLGGTAISIAPGGDVIPWGAVGPGVERVEITFAADDVADAIVEHLDLGPPYPSAIWYLPVRPSKVRARSPDGRAMAEVYALARDADGNELGRVRLFPGALQAEG